MKDVIVKLYPDMINNFMEKGKHHQFQKLVIGGACQRIHYAGDVGCEDCANEKEYLYLHFNVTGSSNICIGEVL